VEDLLEELNTEPEILSAPQAHYARMREVGSVVRGARDLHVCTRVEVERTLRDYETFASIDATQHGNVRPLIPLSVDPPEQRKYRRLLDPVFAPQEIAKREPQVTALVNELIDAFIDRGECDFGNEFAIPFPSQVLLDLAGMPLSDLPFLLSLKNGIIRPPGVTDDDKMQHRRRTAQQIYEYFDAILDDRAKDLRDDMLSRLLTAEVDGERLTREEILDIGMLFIMAGLDTVTDALECNFATLARRPDLRRQIVQDPSIIPSAVEELLRWETVVPTVARRATTDVEVGGCPIHAGEIVHVNLGSANTDGVEFADADTVDLRRSPNRHLAFGGGVHRCLGSNLARRELQIATREWHRRIPDYWLKEGVHLAYTPSMRSVEGIVLEFPT
jgi:cytochrome P450